MVEKKQEGGVFYPPGKIGLSKMKVSAMHYKESYEVRTRVFE